MIIIKDNVVRKTMDITHLNANWTMAVMCGWKRHATVIGEGALCIEVQMQPPPHTHTTQHAPPPNHTHKSKNSEFYENFMIYALGVTLVIAYSKYLGLSRT